MTKWEDLLERYGGTEPLRQKIDYEGGFAEFVVGYIGAEHFIGGPLEQAARKIEEGLAAMEAFDWGDWENWDGDE